MSRYIVVPGGVAGIMNTFEATGAVVDEDSMEWGISNWNYYKRSPQLDYDKGGYYSMWYAPRMIACDQTSFLFPATPQYNWLLMTWGPAVYGNAAMKYIIGFTKDQNGNPLASASVQGFRTVDDLYVGQAISGSDGRYELATTFPATNHYATAYLPGSPDVMGTTVNTLQGTNRDGT